VRLLYGIELSSPWIHGTITSPGNRPVPFSHKHHHVEASWESIAAIGQHGTVEKSSFRGIAADANLHVLPLAHL